MTPKVWLKRLFIGAAYAIILTYFFATPDNLLEKANWVAYAVCHRIPEHSLLINGSALPLCARCTGTFLGSILALGAYFVFRRHASELPAVPIVAILFGFTILWGLDGTNSFVTDLTPLSGFYQPQNWLRLLTGTLNGLMMGSMLYPIANQTFWREPSSERVLRDFRDLGLIVLLGLVAVVLVLLDWHPILYAAALLSSAGVLAMLTLVNTVILLILTRQDNQAERWQDLILPLLGGLALSVVLVGIIGAVRYVLTGTLTSLPGLTLW